MYRVTSHILSSRSILYCRPAAEIQMKTVSRCPPLNKYKKATERDTCPRPLPPPPPPPKDDKLLWGALTVLVLAGGFAYYAKQSPEVRDWLSVHAPWFDDFIAVASEENMTYGEFYEQCVDDAKKFINDYFSDTKPKQCSLDGDMRPIQAAAPSKVVAKSDGDEKPVCVPKPAPIVTKNICEVEECIRDFGETVVTNYTSARDACAYYNKLVEETMLDFSMLSLNEVHEAMAERDMILQESKDNITVAKKKLEDLTRYLECGVQAPKESINVVRGLISDLQDKITAAKILYQWENDKSVALDAHVTQVEDLMIKYTDENQTLFSGLKYDQKKPFLTGDPDLLLYHSFRYATRLQNELNEGASGMTERINRALETLPQDDQALKNRNYLIQSEYKKKKYEMDRDFRKRYDDQKAANDKTLKDALKLQLERHEENLRVKLLQKEKEATVKLNKMVAEKVASEKKIFDAQLADMAAKLKVVEDKLNARLKAERETRRSQELWAAGASLLAATKKGEPIVKVDKELQAIEKASGDEDKLVKTVLKAIPDSVRTQGLVPESVLRARYHRMEKAALRVALVEEDGGPLHIFFLSWIQSLLLFMKLSCIPQCEYDKPPAQPGTELDTFDLLRRARFWIERGNLSLAARYVSSLQGASRLAASTWFDAARAHLETRQAAEAVLAHAAACGLQYL